MNVTCTGCPAKYAVPDEKVRGKKVRITCKHCGTNIVVDGSTIGAEQSAAPKPAEPAAVAQTEVPVKAAAPVAPVPTESSYVVGFTDERQETLTVSEIVSLYAGAKMDDETLVWKDGMANWLAPFDVPEIATSMLKRGVTKRATAFSLANATDDEPTVVGRSPLDEDNTEISSAPRHALDFLEPTKPAAALRKSAPELNLTPAAASPKPVVQAASAKPVAAAARRVEKRAAVDLFGGVADAGSETDASLDLGIPADDAHKMTGARNESSVLFSLDSLTKPDPKAASTKKARDKAQEKDANALLFGDGGQSSLANLGGGGGLAALGAPDFSKPFVPTPEAQVRPSDPVEVPNSLPEKKKGVGIWVVAVLGIAAAAGVAFFMMQKKNAERAAAAVVQEATVTAAPATPSAAAPSAAPEPAAPSAAPEAPAASAEAPSAAELTAQALTAAGAAKPTTTATATATATAATLATPATVNKPAAAADAKKAEAPAATPAPAPAADGAAFDKGAAVTALGAAAANAGSCKKPDGPTGSGKVSVTFAPSGRATMTNVGGAFAGTEVGGCVARLFRSAKVPAFAGDAVTVSKSFSIE
ncbi:MAG: zinc-ribbon domain-containing protein [Polyangiaceae bacterium]